MFDITNREFWAIRRSGLCRVIAACAVVGVAGTATAQTAPPPSAPDAPPTGTRRGQTIPGITGPIAPPIVQPPEPPDRRYTIIPNPVVHTNSFPIGITEPCDSWVYWSYPYVQSSGGDLWIRSGYPFPIVYPSGNLTPGQEVVVPTPAWWRTQYEGAPLVETTRRVDPDGASAPAVPSLAISPAASAVDEGREALRGRDYARAAAIYRRRDAEQRAIEAGATGAPLIDRSAARLLAVAMVGEGNPAEAASILAAALGEDPALASRRLDGKDLLGSLRETRRLANEAMRHAKANPSREAWELVATLMDAEGRTVVAAQMRKRGESPPTPERATPTSSRPASFRMPSP